MLKEKSRYQILRFDLCCQAYYLCTWTQWLFILPSLLISRESLSSISTHNPSFLFLFIVNFSGKELSRFIHHGSIPMLSRIYFCSFSFFFLSLSVNVWFGLPCGSDPCRNNTPAFRCVVFQRFSCQFFSDDHYTLSCYV